MFSHEIHFGWETPSQSGIPAAVAAAQQADTAIVFANDAQGEGMDRNALSLPGDQNQLIEAVAKANPRTVVVLNTGGPVLMPWLSQISSVLEAWYPGQQFGPAIAAVLFGDANPGGRLPVTFPAGETQGPALANEPSEPTRGQPASCTTTRGWTSAIAGSTPPGSARCSRSGTASRTSDSRSRGSAHVLRPDRGRGIRQLHVTNTASRAGSTAVELFLKSPPAAQ